MAWPVLAWSVVTGRPIAYLDHAATSPLRPEALAAMVPVLGEHFGNPSGAHRVARQARWLLDDARALVASTLSCDEGEIVFCAGGTESCNLAVLGGARPAAPSGPATVVVSAVEHHAVLLPAVASGATVVPVGRPGVVDVDALSAALTPEVALVSVMAANNEVGTVQPLQAVAEVVRRRAPGALLHSDAVAAASTMDLAPVVALCDLVSVAGHKVGGPKGSGVLVVRRGARLAPVLRGGPQERERRPGTHDVAGAVGLAAALESAAARRDDERRRIGELRARLAGGLMAVGGVEETVAAGGGVEVLAGTCHVLVDGVDAEELLILLDEGGVCASAGAACASGASEPSHVLAAMGVPQERARRAVRFSLGWSSTDADVDLALSVFTKAVEQLRASA